MSQIQLPNPKLVLFAAAVALAAAAGGASDARAQVFGYDTVAGQDNGREWEFSFIPYLFAPSISGAAAVGRAGGDVEVDTGTIFNNLEAAFLARLEGRHSSGYGFAIDYSMMNLGKGATSPVGNVKVDIDQKVLDIAGTYRFGKNGNVFDAYAGLRHWDLEQGISITSGPLAGTRLDRGKSWTDPVVGLRWQRRLSNNWRAIVQGDIGGFGVSSDFAWMAAAGGAYEGWENATLFVMVRATGVDYETGTPGTSSYFKYDTVTAGPLVGIGFRF